MPAEWEEHEAVWISFFDGETDSATAEMAARISARTKVRAVAAADLSSASIVRADVSRLLNARGARMENVEIIVTDAQVQVRDTGPIFVRDERGELRVVDFKWNAYGTEIDTPDEYPFDARMADERGFPLVKSTLAMEGGALETNGKGTVLQVESVTLQRNPTMTREEIEDELARTVGAKSVIWLEEGPADDPYGLSIIDDQYVVFGIGGHVDGFARFVDENTVLLAFPDSARAASDPVKRLTYERMQRNYDILTAASDQDGNPLEIIKVTPPDVPYEDVVVDAYWERSPYRELLERNPNVSMGDTLSWVPPTSYLSYFITNGFVFVPSYWRPDLPEAVRLADERIQRLLRSYYPDREIVPIDPRHMNQLGGGIHCWTQQQPL